jgi:hypothetical protein
MASRNPRDTMSAKHALAGFLLLFACVGCSQSPKAELADAAKHFDEAADLLSTVKDRDSYEKAKPKILKFEAWNRERHQRRAKELEAIKQMPSEEKEKAEKKDKELKETPEYETCRKAIRKYATEWTRVINLPEVGDLYEKEIIDDNSEKKGDGALRAGSELKDDE